MPQLILSQKVQAAETRFHLQKKMITVGTEPGHDLVVESEFPGIVFTLTQKEGRYEILPARGKLKVNGQVVSRSTRLCSCDRLEWSRGFAVYLDSDLPVGRLGEGAGEQGKSLQILQNVASTLQGSGGLQVALYQVLDSLIEMAGAEAGYLLSEMGDCSGWRLAASRTSDRLGQAGQTAPTKKEIFSNTILHEALKRREPVHVENIIGHPWAEAASVIEARIFSAACFPLCLGEKVFGAVFLLTRSPGKSIKKEVLPELSLLATQAALMLAGQAELSQTRKENARLRKLVTASPTGLIYSREGEVSPMAEVARKIEKLARTPLSVLILGETGSGKEVVAREIHERSERARAPFVAVNCAAIPATLLETTLFGHEKGAFTGAIRSSVGKFVQASGGTLFLDEIGDLPLELQAKLLRVLQERKVEPVGSEASVSVDIRVLAATHQDLEAAVKSGRFRQDLFFRLNGATLKVPALRDRRMDLVPLSTFFLEKSGSALKLSSAALDALKAHDWPGNVRELEQVITRSALLSEGPEITAEDLELQSGARAPELSDERELFWSGLGEATTLQEAQFAFTREFVRRALSRHGENRSETALRLGISERTLYRVLSEASDRTGRLS